MINTSQLFVRNLTGYFISLILHLFLIIHWAFKLLSIIGIGYKWITAALRLALFAILLMPAWFRPLWPYVFSQKILRGIPYGNNLRNVLDIYLPPNLNPPAAGGPPPSPTYPVAVLVWGGAWTIGYKAWPFILAQRLASFGIICVVIDYRNFPQGNIINMVEDINSAMIWTFKNISSYGGDPEAMTLVGQSAGAHLTILNLLQQAKGDGATAARNDQDENNHVNIPININKQKPGEAVVWDYWRLRHYVGMSGTYDLVSLKPILDKHGLAEVLFRAIMDQDINSNSPIFYLKANFGNFAHRLPPITLVHGTKDKTVESNFTLEFAEEMRKLDINVNTKIFEGKSHTDFFLEDMIEGNGEAFIDYLASIILQNDNFSAATDNNNNKQKALTYPFLVKLARIVNPF